MSNTRRAQKNSDFRQERFASSKALRKGLLGNLVARRCEALQSQADRKLVYFLHELSLRDGFAVHRSCNLFPAWPWPSHGSPDESAFERVARELTELHPDCIESSRRYAQLNIAEFLPLLCLDPGIVPASAGVRGFRNLIVCLRDYQAKFEKAIIPRVAQTEVRETIFEALDFAMTQRGIVLVEGAYRSGKSFCSQAWCQMHLGESRYASLNSSGSDADFYRAIARSVGVACSLQMKAAEMRARVEETLRGQQLLLCLDEADYIWNQSTRVCAPPERVNWLLTAIVNQGVPVALIGSANFTRLMLNTERRCPVWGSEQFHGRVKLRKTLPANLSRDDLFSIARLLLPHASEPSLMLLVGFALESKGRVSALENAALRAKFFADQRGCQVSFEDIETAMEESGYRFPASPRAHSKRNDPVSSVADLGVTRLSAAGSRRFRESFANDPPREF